MSLNENAKKWVAALRSGEFKQGRHRLHLIQENSHCCLGVLCELYQREVGDLLVEPNESGFATRYDGEACHLVQKVMDWAGVQDTHGKYFVDVGVDEECQVVASLTAQNDAGKTFDEIADIIESEPKGLFVS